MSSRRGADCGKACGSGPILAWLEAREIAADVRVIEHLDQHERQRREAGLLPRSTFTHNAASDSYTCPQGARLEPVAGGDSVVQYVSRVKDCRRCPVRADAPLTRAAS